VLVNLDAGPAWTVVLAEILGLGVLGVALWFIVKPSSRRRMPFALGLLVVLALVQTAIQERGWRVAAWLIDAIALTVALSALGRHGGPFAKYRRIEEKWAFEVSRDRVAVQLPCASAWELRSVNGGGIRGCRRCGRAGAGSEGS
jgi:hypothetical protein